jgi:hypothetical protein
LKQAAILLFSCFTRVSVALRDISATAAQTARLLLAFMGNSEQITVATVLM